MRKIFEWCAAHPTAATVVLVVAAFAVAYEAPARMDGIETAAARGKYGYTRDYYIVQRSHLDPSRWDRVVLVYGFGDDYEACQDFVAAYSAKVPENGSALRAGELRRDQCQALPIVSTGKRPPATPRGGEPRNDE